MPMYEFHCQECQRSFQVKRPMAAAGDPAVCPHCHSAQTRKRLTAVAFRSSGGTYSIPLPMAGSGGGCGCGGGGCACHN